MEFEIIVGECTPFDRQAEIEEKHRKSAHDANALQHPIEVQCCIYIDVQ